MPGIEPPDVVKGYTQNPIQGTSMRYTFEDAEAAEHPQTQYYEMLGTRAIYHDGWKAVALDTGRSPASGNFDEDEWELYNVDKDRSECHDLADKHPEQAARSSSTLWCARGRAATTCCRSTTAPRWS